jgi:hypothetical protein
MAKSKCKRTPKTILKLPEPRAVQVGSAEVRYVGREFCRPQKQEFAADANPRTQKDRTRRRVIVDSGTPI